MSRVNLKVELDRDKRSLCMVRAICSGTDESCVL